MQQNMPKVQVKNLTKKFDDFTAVESEATEQTASVSMTFGCGLYNTTAAV